MTAAVAIGLVATLVFCLAGVRVARLLPPAAASVLLVGGGVCVAAATAGVLATVAFTAVVRIPMITRAGDWQAMALRQNDPVPVWVAIGCGLSLVPLSILLIRTLVKRARAVAHWYRVCWSMSHVDGLIVVDSDRPEAFAAPVGRGRIVVSTGMLRALPEDEQRALLAHEGAHVSFGHAWWLMAADLAAAVNPLLSTNARAVRHTLERWADEAAAGRVGDRELVARALARASLHAHDSRADPVSALAAASGRVGDRVRALLSPAPRFRLLPAIVLLALTAATAGGAVMVLAHTDDFLDHATVASSPADD